MKRLIYPILALSIAMFACSIPATVTPTVVTEPPIPPSVTAVVLTDTPPGPQANITCNELSLYLDPALASGFDCQTIAEVSGPDLPYWGMNPQYTEVTLSGYVLSDRFFTAHIDVFPVQRFNEIASSTFAPRLTALQALIAGGPLGTEAIPLLPIFNAAQQFYARYQVMPFGSGTGVRYLTQYSQSFDPINNHEMFYSFQGLTADGKYWISAILPVSDAILPANGDNPPDGQTWDQFSNNFPAYVVDITNQLNSQSPDSFSPGLAVLDALIASIKAQP
jgi:hypothetical protein